MFLALEPLKDKVSNSTDRAVSEKDSLKHRLVLDSKWLSVQEAEQIGNNCASMAAVFSYLLDLLPVKDIACGKDAWDIHNLQGSINFNVTLRSEDSLPK